MNDMTTSTPTISQTPTAGSNGVAAQSVLGPTDTFIHRHIGPNEAEQREMLGLLGYSSLD